MDRGSKQSTTPSTPPRSVRPPRALSRIEEEERDRSSSDSSLLASSHSRKFWFASSSFSSSKGGNAETSIPKSELIVKKQEDKGSSSPGSEMETQKAYGREKQTKTASPTSPTTTTLSPNQLATTGTIAPEKSSASPRSFGRWLRKSIVPSPPSPPSLKLNPSSESRQDDGSRKTDSSVSPTKSPVTTTANLPTNRSSGVTEEEKDKDNVTIDHLSLDELNQLNETLESQCEALESTIERSRLEFEMYKMQTSIDLSTHKSMVSRALNERQQLTAQCAELERQLEELRIQNFDTQKEIMALEHEKHDKSNRIETR